MPYTVNRYEVIVAKSAALSSLADIGNWSPGYQRHLLRAWALIIENEVGGTGIVACDKRILHSSDTGRIDAAGGVINLTTAHTQGKVVYKDGLDLQVDPGDQLVWEVTDLTLAGDLATIVAWFEVWPEVPGNLTDLVATT